MRGTPNASVRRARGPRDASGFLLVVPSAPRSTRRRTTAPQPINEICANITEGYLCESGKNPSDKKRVHLHLVWSDRMVCLEAWCLADSAFGLSMPADPS